MQETSTGMGCFRCIVIDSSYRLTLFYNFDLYDQITFQVGMVPLFAGKEGET